MVASPPSWRRRTTAADLPSRILTSVSRVHPDDTQIRKMTRKMRTCLCRFSPSASVGATLKCCFAVVLGTTAADWSQSKLQFLW